MTERDRIIATLKRQPTDRIPKADSYWPETVARWRKEGLPATANPYEHFQTQPMVQMGFDWSLRLPKKVFEETPRYVVEQDANGLVWQRFKTDQSYSPPRILDALIKTRQDWERHKHLMAPSPARVPADARQRIAAAQKAGKFVTLDFREHYRTVWAKLGVEQTLEIMATDPDWFCDMCAAYNQCVIESLKPAIADGIQFDGCWVYGDIAYRNALMFSPRMFRELLFPYHKELYTFLNARGIPVIYHCDGDMREALPMLVDAGIKVLQPMEAKANMDVRDLKPLYGDRLVFFGNIDVREMSKTRADIEREVWSKLTVAMKGGGYMYYSDHSVPPTVNFENYSYVMQLVDELGHYS